jgi:hypothetical protein
VASFVKEEIEEMGSVETIIYEFGTEEDLKEYAEGID